MKHNQQAFIAAYNKLNPEQKKAVDTLSGPVIVNAGPGTGKTQILATRIGNILLKTDTDPNNILCLTYTDNGAVEMRNRLLSIIGLPAYGIRIHTFHSFCNEVIQDNISYFGKLNLEPIGDIEKIDLFAKLIDSIENDNILKRFKGDVYYEAPRMESLFSLMKKEAWDVEHMSSRIDKYISMLPEKEGFFYKRKYKEFNAGDPNPGKIETEKEKMEILRAAVKLYPRYNQMMSDINRYNFDDMILWVLDAFKKNKNILSDYQERFQFFLVDEFQDTSRSQNLLLEYLLSYWDNNPDVFVVGDADQSIFAFQDANVENIENFRKKYTGQITEINLVNNYRSTQIILDAAHELIKNNNGRTTGNDAPLKASGINNQHSTRFEIIEYPNSSQEAMGVALQIESLIHQNIKGSEIAVIYRNHAQVEQIISILDHKKIPVNTRRKADVLQLPFIQNIITLLTWIDKETTIPFSGDDLLFRILHFDFFAITPIQIARLSLLVNEKNNPGKTDKYYLRRIIAESKTSNGDLFNQPDNLVKETSNTLENLLKASGNLTVQHLIELVIQKAGALNYIMKSDEKPWLMQALNAFFNFVKDECKRNPSLTLHGVLTTISLMMKHRIRLDLNKVSATDNGINLITAHGSKGSEFEHVFVIGCSENIWDNTNKNSKHNYAYPDNLLSSHNASTDTEESRRLFYVALTRAKTNLTISYPAKDNNDKPLVKSKFITEILTGMNWETHQKEVPESELAYLIGMQFIEKARPQIEVIEEAYIARLLKNYSLSVTHLNNFLDCPLKFYYQNLIKVPAAKSESMVFGSAIHYALQRLFEKMKENGKIFPSHEEMLSDFDWYMSLHRDAFTPEEFKRRNDYGKKIIPPYYNNYINTWNKIVVVEKPFRNILFKTVPLNGKLDKIEFDGKNANVVDYKTGSYENGKKKLQPPSDKAPNGGDYWRQAVFYKILIENDKSKDWKAESTTFDFVEPVNKEYKNEKIFVREPDIETVAQQITNTWQKIQDREFYIGCGKPDCHWCNFVKTNNMAVAFHELDENETE